MLPADGAHRGTLSPPRKAPLSPFGPLHAVQYCRRRAPDRAPDEADGGNTRAAPPDPGSLPRCAPAPPYRRSLQSDLQPGSAVHPARHCFSITSGDAPVMAAQPAIDGGHLGLRYVLEKCSPGAELWAGLGDAPGRISR